MIGMCISQKVTLDTSKRIMLTRSLRKRVRDQEELAENRDERSFLSVFSPLRHAFRVLVSTLNVKAFDEKKKVAKEWFMPWDVLEDAIPYLRREEIIFITGGLRDIEEDSSDSSNAVPSRTKTRLLNSMELYNTLTHQVELSKDTLRTARCDHSSVIVDGVLYIMGGGTTEDANVGQPLRDVEAYDTVYRQWRPSVPNMSIARRSHCSVGLNGFVYVMGGISYHRGLLTLNHVERLNTKTLSWEECNRLLYPRKDFAASVYLDKIYVVGGTATGLIPANSVERFDPAIGIWVELYKITSPMPLFCGAALAPGVGPGTLLLCGGLKRDKIVADTEMLELETGMITPRTPGLHEARCACAVVTSGDSVYVLGGTDLNGESSSGVESIEDKGTGGWVERSSLKVGRVQCAAAAPE